MDPSPCAEPTLAPAAAEEMLDLADRSIAAGLRGWRPRLPALRELSPALRPPQGVFVTLHVGDELNGCIGTIEAVEPLGRGVVRHAWSAAFADPRLPLLRRFDLDRLTVGISVLSALLPVEAGSREELLASLRPGTDGLVIRAGSRGAVFLPSVWDQLPDKGVFLDHLLAKAGLSTDSWPRRMQAECFTAVGVERGPGHTLGEAEPPAA